LKRIITRLESEKVDLENNMKATELKKQIQDQELYHINGGVGGGYDQYIDGDVIKNIDMYHDSLKSHVRLAADEIKDYMEM